MVPSGTNCPNPKGEIPVSPHTFPSLRKLLFQSSHGARPSAEFVEAGSPVQGEGDSEMKRRQRQGSVERFPDLFKRVVLGVVCGILDVTETLL